jgi:putative transport protein
MASLLFHRNANSAVFDSPRPSRLKWGALRSAKDGPSATGSNSIMAWIVDLFLRDSHSVGHALLILCVVIVLGLALGAVRISSFSLGVAAVLFVGLAFGHFGMTIDPVMLDFARDFGLILFIYSIGQEVGPGLLASLRRQGVTLNLLAALIIVAGGAVALLLHRAGGIPLPAAAGLYSGATTNTPSLAAAQQALKLLPPSSNTLGRMTGIAYALAYPFGIFGIILVITGLRIAFRIDPRKEAQALESARDKEAPRLTGVDLEVQNPALDGQPVSRVIAQVGGDVVLSRLQRGAEPQVIPRARTIIRVGDVLHAVGTPAQIEKLKALVGRESGLKPLELPSDLVSRRILVTRRSVLGKSVQELNLREAYGIVVTRILRTGFEFSPRPGFRIQFGDMLMAVGRKESIEGLAAAAGDVRERLNQSNIIPVFIGIALGVLLGSLPIRIPGMAVPFRIGLAGGPLIAAIILSRIGTIGPLVWYLPSNAILLLRNMGIALFLACVGIRAGEGFVATLLNGGWSWILGGALITLLPLLLVSLIGRLFFKVNFLSLCGLLAGSMTDPPALAFANAQEPSSDGPLMAFVTVYPLTMLLRVFTAQALVLFFWR